MKSNEIALAGCLGAVAGLATAITLEWPLLLSVLIGMPIAFLSFRPWEVMEVIRRLSADLGQAAAAVAERKRLAMYLRQTLKVALYASIAVASACMLPLLLMSVGVTPLGDEAIVENVAAMGIAALALGAIGVVLVIPVAEEQMGLEGTGEFLMCRWFMRRYQLRGQARPSTLLERMKFAIGIPIALQLLSVLIVMFVLDIVLALLLACASTQRLASVLGAALGCIAGTVCHAAGLEIAPVILLVGGVTGWFAGPLLYQLRTWLVAAESAVA